MAAFGSYQWQHPCPPIVLQFWAHGCAFGEFDVRKLRHGPPGERHFLQLCEVSPGQKTSRPSILSLCRSLQIEFPVRYPTLTSYGILRPRVSRHSNQSKCNLAQLGYVQIDSAFTLCNILLPGDCGNQGERSHRHGVQNYRTGLEWFSSCRA